MKHRDKKAIIASCRAVWDQLPLTDEEKQILKERYMDDGTVRMTNAAIAATLGIPLGRVTQSINRAVVKITAYAQEQARRANEPKVQPKPDTMYNMGEEIYPSSRSYRPWYRSTQGNEFETLDIVLAAGLMAKGYKFIAIRDGIGSAVKKRIVLEVPPEEVMTLMEDFMAQNFHVDVSVYHSRLKALKNVLYNKYNSPANV